MKSFLLFFTFLSITFNVLANDGETIQINGYDFKIKTIEGPSFREVPYIEIELFNDEEQLLSHILSNEISNSNGSAIQLGAYGFSNDQLILYSYWAWVGDPSEPKYGFRKQAYKVTPTGDITLLKGEIYLEEGKETKSSDENEGSEESEELKESQSIEFLFKKPRNASEKKQLSDYKKMIEDKYNASFVEGSKKTYLMYEVKSLLAGDIKRATDRWSYLDCDYKK